MLEWIKENWVTVISCGLVIVVLILTFYPYVFGNKQLLDFNQTYNYAIVNFPDGVKKIELSQWTDYDGEQIQLIDTKGNAYLVSSVNAVLVDEAN